MVPQSIVRPEEINYKEKMAVRPFQSPVPFIWPTATLTFKSGEHEWEEKVVVAPGDPEGGEKVLYSLNVKEERDRQLLSLVNKREEKNVNQVQTRRMIKEEKNYLAEDEKKVAEENSKVCEPN